MEKDLTSSVVVRQNVLNNTFAVEEIQKAVGIKGVLFEQTYLFVKKQLADFYGVTERTIENCLEKNDKELQRNGYEVLRGKRLIDFKLAASAADVSEMDFGNKIPQLNGYMSFVGRFMAEMENISYHLAAGSIEKDLLGKIIHSILEGEQEFDEDLKMQILEAIGGCEIGFAE